MLSTSEIQSLQGLINSQTISGYPYYFAYEYYSSASTYNPDYVVMFSDKPFLLTSKSVSPKTGAKSFQLSVYNSSRSSQRDTPRIVKSDFVGYTFNLNDWNYTNCKTIETVGYSLPNIMNGGYGTFESYCEIGTLCFTVALFVSLFGYAIFGFFRR